MSNYDYENEEYEDYSYDYNDDIDWARETFYALGGWDYDEFKSRGGEIDDMMTWLGLD